MERQMYEIVIQSAANGKVLAREALKAYRKNVLAKCYGEPQTQLNNTLLRDAIDGLV